MKYETFVSKPDIYLFNTGNAQKAYLHMGCHYIPQLQMYRFCVWAPHAKQVSLVGDFNNWDSKATPMEKYEGGMFVAFVSGLKQGDLYKYVVTGYDGVAREKSDPFGFYSELRPNKASRIWSLEGYDWQDGEYMEKRRKRNLMRSPISIYEMHLGSWRKHKTSSKEEDGFMNYREIAAELVPYLKKMGYTHVELMPVTEYPFDDSWGYQVTGYYAITSRYGTPQDFMYLVDALHKEGIGVIVDWVPAHFPKDENGLARFDGTHLFEYADPRLGEHPDWGTLVFNYSKPEVISFLVSSAMFFVEQYHVDGLRMDAVSTMLYLDYGRRDGDYVRNKDGGNINLEAVDLLRKINTTVLTYDPSVLMVAEESTAFPMVTRPPYDGGLGFSFKWNMGFMNDTLEYMKLDPYFRKFNHGKVTFSMQYAFSENYILAFSHDEVVHGKCSMVNKMFGEYEQKFASLRAFYGYVYGHPGKKLFFMGDEFGQFIEWNHHQELDWFLAKDYEMHRKMQQYSARLNHIYTKYRCLYEIDDSWDGFQWISVDDGDNSVLAFLRCAKPRGKKVQKLLCIINFTPVQRDGYLVGLPARGKLKQVLNSDEKRYGGSGVAVEKEIKVKKKAYGGFKASAAITLPPLSVQYFEYTEEMK